VALFRALMAEFLGTAFLLATVVGSGALAERLALGNVALCVLCVAFATGLVLYALILCFGSLSAHFNPVVTLVSCLRRQFAWRNLLPYLLVQLAGACAGVMVANLMFDLPLTSISTTLRGADHPGQWIGEIVATFGLIGMLIGVGKSDAKAVPFAVSAYVAGAICFTSSTCFANPAVTVSRMLTSTLTGIAPASVPGFIIAQLAGALLAVAIFEWLFSTNTTTEMPLQTQATEETMARLEELVKR